jgi:hypothetical protein
LVWGQDRVIGSPTTRRCAARWTVFDQEVSRYIEKAKVPVEAWRKNLTQARQIFTLNGV